MLLMCVLKMLGTEFHLPELDSWFLNDSNHQRY